MRVEPDRERLASQIESVLLAAAGPVHLPALVAAVERPLPEVRECVENLIRTARGGIRVQRDGDAVQLVTAPENAPAVQRFLGVARPPALSRSALEVLTVVAYRQPVTRPEVEAIRGINSDRALSTLAARGLIEEKGHRPGPGRPTEYGTTFGFLEYFGLSSLDDLPPLPQSAQPATLQGSLGLRAADITKDGSSPDEPPSESF